MSPSASPSESPSESPSVSPSESPSLSPSASVSPSPSPEVSLKRKDYLGLYDPRKVSIVGKKKYIPIWDKEINILKTEKYRPIGGIRKHSLIGDDKEISIVGIGKYSPIWDDEDSTLLHKPKEDMLDEY